MTPYEVENIAHQKVNSRRDEGAMERLVEGRTKNQSNTLPQTIAAAKQFSPAATPDPFRIRCQRIFHHLDRLRAQQ